MKKPTVTFLNFAKAPEEVSDLACYILPQNITHQIIPTKHKITAIQSYCHMPTFTFTIK